MLLPEASSVRQRANVRYSEATEGFEMFCPDCERYNRGTTFWPLTLEFWAPGRLQRCRACERALTARQIAARRKADPEWYARMLAETRSAKAAKNYIYNRTYRERRKAREAAELVAAA